MRVYLDTSVILRRLFNEPDPIPDWGRWESAFSSRIWRVEALRTVDRLRLSGALRDEDVAELRREIDLVDSTLHLVPVNEAILERAGEALPTVVGTLDALHLASALAAHKGTRLDAFLTHDQQQATAATSVGFDVRGL